MTEIKIIIRQKKIKLTNALPTGDMSLLRYRPKFAMQRK